MSAVYRAQMIKYLRSGSTWVITLVAMGITVLISALLPNLAINKDSPNGWIEYLGVSENVLTTIIGALTAFITIFSGFKAATMHKDEVENGNFLVLLSKPISRSKIILSKWFALFTLILFHVIIVGLSYVISVYLSDMDSHKRFHEKIELINKQTLTQRVWSDFGIIISVLLLLALLFSSIALLITTKFALSSSIAATIGLGILIPISSIFGTFTEKDEYKSISSKKINNALVTLDNLKNGVGLDNKELINLSQQFYDDVNEYKANIKSSDNLHNMAFLTKNKNTFYYTKYLDLDYQVRVLSLLNQLEEDLDSDSVLAKMRDQFIAKQYYLRPIDNDNFNKSTTISEKNKAFEEKMYYTLKEINKSRDDAFRFFYNLIYEFVFNSKKKKSNLFLEKIDKNLKLTFSKPDLLYILSLIRYYLEGSETGDEKMMNMMIFDELKKEIESQLAKNEYTVPFMKFSGIIFSYHAYYSIHHDPEKKPENAEHGMNYYLERVSKNQSLNYSAILRVIMNSLLKEIHDIDIKQGLAQLLKLYYHFESPLAYIVFDQYNIENIIFTNNLSVDTTTAPSKVKEYYLTDFDREILGKVYSLKFNQDEPMQVFKVEKRKYMDRTTNAIVYGVLTVILVFVSVYVITKQDFQ
ncbi:ABC-type transport system involved in multi-copper enzyme maturation, permease component [Mycoplasmopsis californica]|uniref:ABC transporter permease n=1 Tax=Mycoplasmopsis equigenitalium TaxID=114883 RepID=A0ABY5J0D5_9BACT|nr:ABC transporter permease subunit [Mycoplasmopsis equigenitalium]UUD36725.1 ABC transporter permease [Mycoplasmopsis equigenitalium]VEU69981.1 ABC-type transport system involved in multi-copper enzyme maturation, permease component [Mycoplasmopsis californica]